MAIPCSLPVEVDIEEFDIGLWGQTDTLQISEYTGSAQAITTSDPVFAGRITLVAQSHEGDIQLGAMLDMIRNGIHTLKIPWTRIVQQQQDSNGNIKQLTSVREAFSIDSPDTSAITALTVDSTTGFVVVSFTTGTITPAHVDQAYKFASYKGRLLRNIGVNHGQDKMLYTPYIDGMLEVGESFDTRATAALYVRMLNDTRPRTPRDSLGLQAVSFDFIESHEGPTTVGNQTSLPLPGEEPTPATISRFIGWSDDHTNWSPS